MTEASLCKCGHARSRHLSEEICIADGCDCLRYSPKGRRVTRGLGGDVTTQMPVSLDAPVREDGDTTLGSMLADKAVEPEDEDTTQAEAIMERGKEAYIEYVTRSLRATAERQWAEYILFVRGAPLPEIARQSGFNVATVYEAINRIRGFLRAEFGVDTPKEYRRPDMLVERKRAKARDLLRNTRLTQKQIAQQVGLSQCTISKICQQMEAEGEKRGRGLQELGERCRNGHPRTEENTLINSKGHRRCRPCWNANHMRWYNRKRKKKAA